MYLRFFRSVRAFLLPVKIDSIPGFRMQDLNTTRRTLTVCRAVVKKYSMPAIARGWGLNDELG